MKFSLVAALVVALAIGSQAMAVEKREVQSEVAKITKFIREMSASISSTTQEVVQRVKDMEVANTAQTYMDDSKAKIQPLVEKVQAEAAKLQEQLKPLVSNIEEQVKPLTDNFQAQVQPLADLMEKFLKQLVEQTQALLPPQ